MTYPDPGSADAIAKGCTCDPKQQTNPNWQMVDPKCPVHGNVDYLLWKAQQGGKRKKG